MMAGLIGRLWGRMTGARQYEAAKVSRIAGGFQLTGARSVNEDVRWDLRGLVNHSRQQAQNNDYLKAYLAMVRRHIVGPQGIRMNAVARDPNGNLDKVANQMIQDAWVDWGRVGNPTIDGAHSWLSLQWLAAETVARDGNMIVRAYRGKGFGRYAYQVQPLEIDHLAFDSNRTANDGSVVRMGVEFDKFGRPVAYLLYRRHPGETSRESLAREVVRVPASDVVLLFRPERPGQVLGVPWSYTALRRLNMLRGYEEAAITAARVGAAKMGFYTQQKDEDHYRPDASLDQQESTATGHLIREVEPGLIEALPPGVDYKEHNPAYPSGEIEPFMKVVLRGAAAGLGVSYASLANDLSSANFSSLRAGQAEERDEWRTLQTWMAQGLHEKIAQSWLEMALLSGAIALPFAKIEKFRAFQWRPRGWAYVSPTDESNANQREMASMLRAPQEIVAERGADLDEVFEQMAEAKALAESYGLVFNPMPPGHETGPAAPDAAAVQQTV